jgi:hypothetical protein
LKHLSLSLLTKNMVVLSKILPLVAIGAGLLFAANIFSRPAAATASAQALGATGYSIGSSLSSVGTGASHLGSGIGKGLAGLLQPAWEIKNLFTSLSNSVAGSANTSPVAQNEGRESEYGSHYHGSDEFGRTTTTQLMKDNPASTITWSNGSSATVPLGQAAKDWYESLGVSVT